MKENKLLQLRASCKQKITLVLFGLFLFFVLLEASLRLSGFILATIQEHRNLQSIKQKGAYRILCLGESTTQGQYPSFLEEILNQSNIGVRFSVVDKGSAGANTPTVLNYVEAYLNEYRPDMVVTMMGINDGGEHLPYEVATTSPGMLLIRSFRTYKLTRLLWLHILTKAKEFRFYESNAERKNFEKDQVPLLGTGSKEVSAELVLTEEAPKKAIELNPKNDQAYVELGQFYRKQGKFHQAEDLFNKALGLNPENDNAYLGLGQLYRNQGKVSQAEEFFKKAIERNFKNDYAYTELGWLYLKQGKYHQAEDDFKKAIEFNPKNDDACFELGWLYCNQGKFSQAQDLFKKVTDLNPKNDRGYGAISALYEKLGKPELAKEYASKANALRLEYYTPATVDNYRKLKEILDRKKIRLVCVQYPLRNLEPLRKIFGKDESIIFVGNERIFKEALKKASYKDYFKDMFGGDFGHCTPKGNRLLACDLPL